MMVGMGGAGAEGGDVDNLALGKVGNGGAWIYMGWDSRYGNGQDEGNRLGLGDCNPGWIVERRYTI